MGDKSDGAGEKKDGEVAKELKREFRLVEAITIATNVILAIVGIFALRAYYGQLHVMQGTLDAMKQSGQATTDQMWAAINNMNWMARSMDNSLQELSGQVGATNRLATQAQRSANTAQRSFEFSERPYVGIERIDALYGFPPDYLGPKAPIYANHATSMTYSVYIRNFGPVAGTNYTATQRLFYFAGTNYTATQRLFYNGEGLPTTGTLPNKPGTIYPTEGGHLQGEILAPDYAKVVNKQIIMTLEITISYTGPANSYSECTKEQYVPENKAFANLGPTCSK